LYYDRDTGKHKKGEKIDLLKLFRCKTSVDISVQIGSKRRVKMRLAAKKLSKKEAKARIESAKKNRHSKSNHSKEYYKLLAWEIYLTNVEAAKLSIEQIAKLYGLRWFIEILFKSWKSYAIPIAIGIKRMLGKEKMNYTRLMITIYLLLIQFVYFMFDIFSYISKKVAEKTDRLMVSPLEIVVLKYQ